MTWRYVPARRIIDGEEMWDVREFYEDLPAKTKNGKEAFAEGTSWTLDPICASGESLDDLRTDLMRMLADLRDPREFLDLDGDKPGLTALP